ncbi:uncharacterized protein Z518_04684 [Rhinocladiella mackenziei CBS 650.93]|uniref:Major facilitator superfamily (MFS) profile domain-containing protein n=1 Tax=Rhinocladiella mackenziei CBS 650.93 TaxID=1442369 RepID=A0A0D2H8D3_9EURO|nr:uncharacterized protein Z518_04684 [Rhinocladiella mackenziei CBS 650.93]KIX06708.1 hypothetical protein Z518_04684 [Rhinocladiella mackenziei CBS 650.93]
MSQKEDEPSSVVHHDDDAVSLQRDSSPGPPLADETGPRHFTYWDVQFIVCFVPISFGFYAAMLETSPSWNLLLVDIPAALGLSSSLNWAYPTLILLQTFSSVLFGRLSDLVGRRWIFVAGKRPWLAGLSVLIGIGTGVQIIGPFLALAEIVPVRHRFVVVEASMSFLAPLYAMYPAIAEALFENTADSWHWPYSINAIFSFVATLGLLIFYHPPTYRELHDRPDAEHLLNKDWKGARGTDSASFGALTYFLLWGRTIFGSFAFRINLGTRKKLTNISRVEKGTDDHSAWSAGLVSDFILAALALIKPKFVKWHLFSGVTVNMVFLAGFAAFNPTRKQMALAFLALAGIGQGYSMLITYVTAPMAAHRRDMGLVTGLLSGNRNLLYAVLQSVFMAILPGILRHSQGPEMTLPMAEAIFAAMGRAATNAWKFIFELANIYFISSIILAAFAADTDKFLSMEI